MFFPFHFFLFSFFSFPFSFLLLFPSVDWWPQWWLVSPRPYLEGHLRCARWLFPKRWTMTKRKKKRKKPNFFYKISQNNVVLSGIKYDRLPAVSHMTNDANWTIMSAIFGLIWLDGLRWKIVKRFKTTLVKLKSLWIEFAKAQ